MTQAHKEEMWYLMLAKSKVMRFAALTCELVLFFGGLWITLTVSDPESKAWADGTINTVFLTIMGFAIDAAMPESWLHVVSQHLSGKPRQEQWSRNVAIAMSLLFIGNILYSFLTAGDKSGGITSGLPTNAQGWVLLTLMVSRISVGFVYITVRECQEFIARHEAKQQADIPAGPPTPPVDVPALVSQAVNEAVAQLENSHQQALNLFRVDQQRMLSLVQEVQNSVPSLDYEALTASVTARLDAHFQTNREAMRQRITVHEADEAPRLEAPKKTREAKASASPDGRDASKILTLRQPGTGMTDKRAALYALLDQGDQRSSYELAPIIGCSAATIQRYVKDWKEQRRAPSHEANEDVM